MTYFWDIIPLHTSTATTSAVIDGKLLNRKIMATSQRKRSSLTHIIGKFVGDIE